MRHSASPSHKVVRTLLRNTFVELLALLSCLQSWDEAAVTLEWRSSSEVVSSKEVTMVDDVIMTSLLLTIFVL